MNGNSVKLILSYEIADFTGTDQLLLGVQYLGKKETLIHGKKKYLGFIVLSELKELETVQDVLW